MSDLYGWRDLSDAQDIVHRLALHCLILGSKRTRNPDYISGYDILYRVRARIEAELESYVGAPHEFAPFV